MSRGATSRATWSLPSSRLGKENPEAPLPVHSLDVATFGMRVVVPQDAGQGENEGRRHVLAGHVLGRMQAEAAHARLKDHLALPWPVPDPVVLHDNDPALTTRLPQPDLVVRVLRKDVVMDNDQGVNLPEAVRTFRRPRLRSQKMSGGERFEEPGFEADGGLDLLES